MNGITCFAETEQEAANQFNNFFVNSIVELSHSIVSVRSWSALNLNTIESVFSEFQLMGLKDLKVIVAKLKIKSNIHEVLTSNFIQKTFDTMGYAYLNFINTSLEFGTFPSELKTSVVTTILKLKEH